MACLSQIIDINEWRDSRDTASIPAAHSEAMRDELRAAFRNRLELPEHHLERRFDESLRYLLDHHGSMMRPRIVYQMAMAYGLNKQGAIDLAIALEYFHSSSLVFDDLPCMDNASMRRGTPCVHRLYGESGAILAALALINRAYALAWRTVSCCPLGVRQQALIYLEQRLGVQGLLNGQSLDLNYATLPNTLDATERVARGKTVSLISLALVMPAILGAASEREQQLLQRISTSWGLGYQIIDDLKDVLQNSSAIGKTAARDKNLGRPNIALAIGVSAAVERLTRLLRVGDRTMETLIELRPSLVFLREFRSVLKDELSRVIEGAGAIPIDSKR